MYRLTNQTRHYAWGSRDFIARFLGRTPSDEPEAELWLGAHPSLPSRLETCQTSLKDAIEADPVRHLGAAVDAEYPARLPFLFKVLAAESPLSLQAHPSPADAKAGFSSEQQRGIPIDDPTRSYRDPFAKPELFVALTECEVLCGFRPASEAAAILTRLGVGSLSPYIASLHTGRAADGLRVVVTTLLSMPDVAKREMAQRVLDECARIVSADETREHIEAYRWAIRLGGAYPGDIGIVLSLLLNLITLRPGQAIYVAGGKMHAYLCGAGLEAQANSDNTLRGGLTPKHVNVAELLRILDFEPAHDQVIDPVEVGPDSDYCVGAHTWPTPAREFALFDWHLRGAERELRAHGPSIVLCLEGEAALRSGNDQTVLRQGESAYFPADEGAVVAGGTARLAHITVGQVPRSR